MRERLRRAWPATLLVFLMTSLCTANSVMVLAMRVPSDQLAESASVLALYTLVKLFDSIAPAPLRYTTLPGLTLLVCAPLLQVLWLRALQRSGSLQEHAQHAKHVYWHAGALYLAGLAYTARASVSASPDSSPARSPEQTARASRSASNCYVPGQFGWLPSATDRA
jgi:hypothetical protein